MKDHPTGKLVMIATVEEPELFTKMRNDRVTATCGSYVDDSLSAGTLTSEELSENTLTKSDSKSRLYDTFAF